ncbi:hypothetical protein ACGFXB_17510 [Streptomyces canus]|uniref:hypothetical protein n=1 Tax=Streptomyces canus TaxID=58343 RepID=UPI003723AD4B
MPTPGWTRAWLCVRQRARVVRSGGPALRFRSARTSRFPPEEQIITRTTELYVDIHGERARATTLAELRPTAGS